MGNRIEGQGDFWEKKKLGTVSDAVTEKSQLVEKHGHCTLLFLEGEKYEGWIESCVRGNVFIQDKNPMRISIPRYKGILPFCPTNRKLNSFYTKKKRKNYVAPKDETMVQQAAKKIK